MIALQALSRGAQQIASEFEEFIDFLDGRPMNTVCEIGSAEGGTFYAWCQLANPEGMVISVDLPLGHWGGVANNGPTLLSYAQPEQTIALVQEDSHSPQTLIRLERILDERLIDLLFIDGDHSYQGVKKDFEMYAPLVGGLVAFHDIAGHPHMPNVQVKRFWEEIRDSYPYYEFSSGDQWGGIGVIEV